MTATRVDFYQLSRDPVDVTTAKLARKVLQAGERLVVTAVDRVLVFELAPEVIGGP